MTRTAPIPTSVLTATLVLAALALAGCRSTMRYGPDVTPGERVRVFWRY
jgi:predicted small secreted protein